jgi:hypothetical protein
VFLDGQPTDVLGTQRTGSFLRANTITPAPINCSDADSGDLVPYGVDSAALGGA